MEVDWASAPEDILECIVKKLGSIDEYILFGSVCRSWNRIIQQQKPWQELALARPSQLPLLLVPSEDGRRDIRKLYNVFNGKKYTLPLTVRYNRRCVGSSHGWLAIFQRNMRITLINPTSPVERRIVLPTFLEREKYGNIMRWRPFNFFKWVTKVVLSHDPELVTPQQYVVASIEADYSTLVFMRLSDREWTYVDMHFDQICDVVFHGGLLYAVDSYGLLISVDLAGDNQVNMVIPRFFFDEADKVYTVKSITGDILLVRRFVGHDDDNLDIDIRQLTTIFEVHRWFVKEEELGASIFSGEWIDVKSLNDDEVLFVGDNESMSFSCSDDDIGSHCKPNSIYYADDVFSYGYDSEFGPIDVGVYYLEDGSIHPTYILNPSQKNFPPPIFIVPKLFCN